MSRAAVAKRCRINNWDDQKDDILLGVLKEQQLLGNGTAGQFPNEAWATIAVVFNHRTDLSYHIEHLKNRLKVLKKAYSLYHDIVKTSGWKWDPVRNVPSTGSPSKWNEIIAVNPEYAKCRDKPFLRYKDLDFLFGKKTEEDSRDNSMTEGNDLDVTGGDKMAEVDDLCVTGKAGVAEVNDLGATGRSQYNTSSATKVKNTELPKHQSKSYTTQPKPQFTRNLFPDSTPQDSEAFSEDEPVAFSPERHITFAVPLSYCHQKRPRDKSDILAMLVDLERQRVEISREQLDRAIALRPKVYSIEDCMKKLGKVEGMSPEAFVVACDVFKDQDRRAIFMNLDGPHLAAWIEHRVKVEMQQSGHHFFSTFSGASPGHVPGSDTQQTPVSEKTNSGPPATPPTE
ncbi:Uncharacterized protein M6B38_241165 [Iris pallida]|uniref:Myb/SANT-like domain-containing protein n=1 Tax=Iris pallida TaxID=29817 RepID=A0AAX6DJ80_IRIPA|nr:Uncharacterized protein M6B38_241165 [Iris pallida]